LADTTPDTRPIPDANLHGKQEKGIDRQGHGAWMGRDEALYNDKEVLRVAIIAGVSRLFPCLPVSSFYSKSR
jgi:hypothetical protein